uniref:Putative metal-dependent phosphohydrolase HD sub domain protein n=1 Tax=uncultured bacterium Ad_125_D08 TaxID=1489285 RepID=A0A0B4N0Y3_9BACT|nr:putative metal-dependent phosphohydrolase HD sub domain protein [uncultured bacterium Ad_125_D08]
MRRNVRDKNVRGDWFEEIIKDADTLRHSLRNPAEDFFYDKPRNLMLLETLVR